MNIEKSRPQVGFSQKNDLNEYSSCCLTVIIKADQI
jgi:hypothetical protein